MKGGEKMEKGQLWTIVGVALVVAVVASIATASITGNVIKLNQDRYGKYKVYTTAETYSKAEVNGLITNIGGTPKNCMAHSFSWSASKNGTAICSEQTKNKCLITEATMNLFNASNYNLLGTESHFIVCDYNFEDLEDETPDGMIINGTLIGKRFQVICCD